MNNFWLAILKPKTWVAKLLLLLSIVGLVFISSQDWFDPVRQTLDSDDLAYQIGTSRISVYLLLKGAFLCIAGLWLAGWVSDSLEKRISSLAKLKKRNKIILVKVGQVVIYVILFLVILGVLGIDLMTLGILGGAIGIGIGFGLQKITSNFISGLILLFENSIEIDDVVELSDGLYGFVRHTSARYTLVETLDGKEVMIPNEDFVTNRVTNWTYSNNHGRIDITLGVAYGSDIDLVMKLLLEAANEHPSCLKEPQANCYIEAFADSSVNFFLCFWIEDVTLGRWQPRSDVMRSIWYKFQEHNIVIPFPQRDINIKKEDAST